LEDDGQMITKTSMGGSEHPIVVFDALCVLCSANAQFVPRYDRRGHFRLAAMQGEIGSELYRRFGVDPANPETLIVVRGASALYDSEAVLAIWSGLGWPWRALTVLRLVPRPLRDRAYRWIARNRYRIFGLRETCWVPTPERANRIL
jgi:predicted DCC family thiol-disulfide oxidoreductase YuxK